MAAGRRTRWNYEGIAHRHNLFYPQKAVTSSKVRSDIVKHKDLFERIVGHEPLFAAYFYLAQILEGRSTEEEFSSRRRPVPYVPLLATFKPSDSYVPVLPAWYRSVVRGWLKHAGQWKTTEPKVPVDPTQQQRRDESASLSLSDVLLPPR